VCKLRLRYAKRGRLRFTSHRDVARVVERGLRRAGLPMAYSQGFNPHPKVSWVGAAPTGSASEAEYVEIQLAQAVDPELVRAELDAALPDELVVLDAVVAGPGSLADRVEASRWRIELPGVPVVSLREAVRALLAAPEVQVERMTKNGKRSIDVRTALVSLEVSDPSVVSSVAGGVTECGILTAVVRQGSPAVRPDDVLSALDVVAGLRPPVPAQAIRMAQGRLDDDGGLVDPLGADRSSTGPDPDRSGDGAQRSDRGGVADHAG
jgi:radical SAM-linked protein